MDLKRAEQLARQRVLALWPELADAELRVAPRCRSVPAPGELSRLALDGGSPGSVDPEEMTFTFRGELRAPDGERLPRVARVTVRAGVGVVRATLTR